jgi:hypothetical protein
MLSGFWSVRVHTAVNVNWSQRGMASPSPGALWGAKLSTSGVLRRFGRISHGVVRVMNLIDSGVEVGLVRENPKFIKYEKSGEPAVDLLS